jgi:hypothetical protein
MQRPLRRVPAPLRGTRRATKYKGRSKEVRSVEDARQKPRVFSFCHKKSGSPSPLDEGRSRILSLDPRMRGKERAKALAAAKCQCLAKILQIWQTLAKPLFGRLTGRADEESCCGFLVFG